MKRFKYVFAAALAAFLVSVPVAACAGGNGNGENSDKQTLIPDGALIPGQTDGNRGNGAERGEETNGYPDSESPGGQTGQAGQAGQTGQSGESKPAGAEPSVSAKVSYIKVLRDGVNIRSGAGADYPVLGSADKYGLYCYFGYDNGWLKTEYRNKTAYIFSEYCSVEELESDGNAEIEAVIAEGTKLIGVPYVYGAVRFHDGNGNRIRGFTADEFDCSSLMQYIFYRGAGELLQVNTRTQIYQGKKVSAANLKRGDLMFFTNAQRRYNSGVERVGHVGLYLGGNYILHTASDYAKIEQISATRWGYFIEGRRIIG